MCLQASIQPPALDRLGEVRRADALFAGQVGDRAGATEDKDLTVWFDANGAPMGSVLPDPGNQDITLTASIQDADEPDSQYEVTAYHDVVRDGEIALAPFAAAVDPSDTEAVACRRVSSGSVGATSDTTPSTTRLSVPGARASCVCECGALSRARRFAFNAAETAASARR
jgi:hypothetical protein